MTVTVKSIASSISEDGVRIDTLQLRYPRMVHADFMTHRVFSRNASSSRAIPHASLTARDAEIFIPVFRKNQPGMQPGDYLSPAEQEEAAAIWEDMARYCLAGTAKLAAKGGLNAHKQWVNRPLEWFGYIEVLVTSTEWSNFDALRDHSDAQDEIEMLAKEMKRVRDETTPKLLQHGQWHLPYVVDEDYEEIAKLAKDIHHGREAPEGVREVLAMLEHTPFDLSIRNALLIASSASRSCRVSYSKHDGARPTVPDDMRRFLQLAGSDPKHASPLEHQARPLNDRDAMLNLQGNFKGWAQFRKGVPNECL